MKNNLYTHALDGLDEALLEEHLQQKTRLDTRTQHRNRWLTATAACVALMAISAGAWVMWDHMNAHYDEPAPELKDVEIAQGDVVIHYITPEGHPAHITRYLFCDAQSIFAAWRTQNGLGEDVRLMQTHTSSNGEEWIGEFEGEGVVGYRPGDKMYLTITVKGLEPYLAAEGGDALLESLKQTLSGYTGLTYETVEVVFE